MALDTIPGRFFRIVSVVGTRPEAIKMAPVVRAIAGRTAIEQRVLLTGQHPTLDHDFPAEIPIDKLMLDLSEQSVGEQREVLAEAICRYLMVPVPDLVIVQGDTTSALAGALAAQDCGIALAHVEAGLRSHNLEPWPEEDNRIAIDSIADLLFAPTAAAAANLAAEPTVKGAVHITGNSGIDALFHICGEDPPPLPAAPRKTILATCHRRENQGEALERICECLRQLARQFPVRIAFLLHPNRHIEARVRKALAGTEHITLIEPLRYADMVRLMRQSWIILTDSGGLQEEGPALGKPVLVLRDVTERVEAPRNVELVGTAPERIMAAVNRLLMNDVHYARMATPALPFGDGKAGIRIADAIENWLLAKLRAVA